jgi:hypothetical protein
VVAILRPSQGFAGFVPLKNVSFDFERERSRRHRARMAKALPDEECGDLDDVRGCGLGAFAKRRPFICRACRAKAIATRADAACLQNQHNSASTNHISAHHPRL